MLSYSPQLFCCPEEMKEVTGIKESKEMKHKHTWTPNMTHKQTVSVVHRDRVTSKAFSNVSPK